MTQRLFKPKYRISPWIERLTYCLPGTFVTSDTKNMRKQGHPPIQHPYYALVYADLDGKLHQETSPSIAASRDSILNHHLIDMFVSSICGSVGTTKAEIDDVSSPFIEWGVLVESQARINDSRRTFRDESEARVPLTASHSGNKFNQQSPLSNRLTEWSWSLEEIIVVIYFTSRYIIPSTLRCLLAHRGYDHTTTAIERMIRKIADHKPSLRLARGQWDVRAVDGWIDGLLSDPESVNHIIRFTLQDAEAVASVSYIPFVTLPCVFILTDES